MKAEFVPFFLKLKGLETGDRAALRRAAGEMLKEADGRQSLFFTVACPMVCPSGRKTVGLLWPVCAACGMQSLTMVPPLKKLFQI